MLAHWNNSPHVDMWMSVNYDTLFWLQANQSFSYFLIPRAYRRCNKYLFYSLCDPTSLEPTIYPTRGNHANNYTTDMVAFY